MTYQLIQGDCLDVMRDMEAGSVHLTVTSPPYDNLREYGDDFDADSFDWRGIIQELYRVTAVGGVVVWVVADATIKGGETLTSFEMALWARDCGFRQETMIYQQAGTGAKGSNYFYWQSWEFMFVWVKGDKPRVSKRIRDKRNSTAGQQRGVGTKYKMVNSRHDRIYTTKAYGIRENIWAYHTGNNSGDYATAHPAPFPEALAHDHIISWSNEGDTVFDPMMGSGTTGKMAVKANRNFIGIELDAAYFAIAQQRIANTAGDFVTTEKERQTGQIALWDLMQ